MIRKAIVASFEEYWINLSSLDEVEKEQCAEASSCGSSGCGCRVSGQLFRAAKPESMELQQGDTVEVSVSSGQALGASLLVFGVPIAMAVGLWMLVTRLLPSFSEGLSAAGAAAGLILGIVLVLLLGRTKRHQRLPQILKVVEKA